jgi:dihydropteroate synthase
MLTWHLRGRVIELCKPIVVGILNTTPDSFSDGGRYLSVEEAVAHAGRMLEDGADIIDVGGESTRPQGARAVFAGEEIERVAPVIREIARAHPKAILSVDTVKSQVAEAAIEAGAHIVNDVSGFRLDPRMAAVCAASRVGVVLMHSRGGVSEMGTYKFAEYSEDPVADILAELRLSVESAEGAGVAHASIAVDPGIGFAKKSDHSLATLAGLSRLVAWGFPVLVGVSRKRFVGEITGVSKAEDRVHGTVGAAVAALARGAHLFRVHDVAPVRQALDVAWAVEAAERRE